MRRRDIVWVGVAFGGVVAGLVWALCTQSRWVSENKAIQMQRPPAGIPETAPPPSHATGVIGTVSDDTRAAVGQELAPRPPKQPESLPPASPKRAPPRHTQIPPN
jgi:hypothetical protein